MQDDIESKNENTNGDLGDNEINGDNLTSGDNGSRENRKVITPKRMLKRCLESSLNAKTSPDKSVEVNTIDYITKTLNGLKEDDNPIETLKSTVLTLAHRLDEYQKVCAQQAQHIAALNQHVAMLAYDNNANKQWQQNVYKQLQQLLPCAEKNKGGKAAATTRVSQPVTYGGTACSKKLCERRTLKIAEDGSPVAIEDNNSTAETTSEHNVINHAEVATSNDAIIHTDVDTSSVATVKQDVEEVKVEEENTETEQTDTEMKILDEHSEIDQKANVKQENDTESSIEESLRNAAEAVVSTSGYVFDETSGLYYDWNTKMYYDPSTKLHYDHTNGVYYYYDTEKNSYVFHSQVTPQVSEDVAVAGDNDAKEEDGEIRSDDDDIDPCIRAIVVHSDVVDVGSLFMVTCQGGSIGSAEGQSICIDDEDTDLTHCRIYYYEKLFFLQDLGSVSGTFVNNERLAEANCTSDAVEVFHKDYVKVGHTTLCFHVHIGRETCVDCEPGNVQAILARDKPNEYVSREELNAQRKKQLKQMRKKYGITPGYLPNKLLTSIPDRADKRRQEVGSEGYEDTACPVQSASVHKHIPEENVGHKMLTKMGWKSGRGLGKKASGITQPVTVRVLQKNKGVGASDSKQSLDAPQSSKKTERWNKARDRYKKLETINF